MIDKRFLGKPITEVIADGEKPELTILLIIDGCKADSLYQSLDSGKLPKLSKLLSEMGNTRIRECVTVFPSVTIACHASIMTGSYPIVHGIVGNNWFIREKWMKEEKEKNNLRSATREYVKRSWWYHKSDPGLGNGYLCGKAFSLANNDLHCKMTIYEAHNKVEPDKNHNILEMVWRGVSVREEDQYKYTDLINLDDFFHIMGSSRERKNAWLDESCIDELGEKIVNKKRPSLIVGWLPGMDGHSHTYGPDQQRPYLMWKGKDCFDDLMGKISTKLKEKKLLNKTLLVITADHGQYPSNEQYITDADIYKTLKREKSENIPLKKDDEKINFGAKKASVVAMGNGGMCHVYLSKDENGDNWDEPPSEERVIKIASILAKDKKLGMEEMFVRINDQYNYWRNGETTPLNGIDEETNKYPLLRERISGLNDPLRAGDILISAKIGNYYDSKAQKGEHGTLTREDSIVPLIFAGKGIRASENPAVEKARVIDIAPTIGKIMGFADYLEKEITQKSKLAVLKQNLLLAKKGAKEVYARRRWRYCAVSRKDYLLEIKDLSENINRTKKEIG